MYIENRLTTSNIKCYTITTLRFSVRLQNITRFYNSSFFSEQLVPLEANNVCIRLISCTSSIIATKTAAWWFFDLLFNSQLTAVGCRRRSNRCSFLLWTTHGMQPLAIATDWLRRSNYCECIVHELPRERQLPYKQRNVYEKRHFVVGLLEIQHRKSRGRNVKVGLQCVRRGWTRLRRVAEFHLQPPTPCITASSLSDRLELPVCYHYKHSSFGIKTFPSPVFSLLGLELPVGTFAPKNESSRELSFLGAKVPGNFRSWCSQFAFWPG